MMYVMTSWLSAALIKAFQLIGMAIMIARMHHSSAVFMSTSRQIDRSKFIQIPHQFEQQRAFTMVPQWDYRIDEDKLRR